MVRSKTPRHKGSLPCAGGSLYTQNNLEYQVVGGSVELEESVLSLSVPSLSDGISFIYSDKQSSVLTR